ncbi:MAG: SpoIVB peptidase [Clostridia bacterium]|nr:SpoIVB peptidase [Clostridia bacterium]
MKKKILSFLFTLTILISLTFSVEAKEIKVGDEVLIGGMPFGIKIYTGEMVVSGFTNVDGIKESYSPAYNAGIREKDIILKINNKTIKSADDVTNEVKNSEGKQLDFTCIRKGTEMHFTVNPIKSQSMGEYRIGVWIKDCTTGIGTITYLDKESGDFGGLGHGICSTENGELLPMKNGKVNEVNISGISKGEIGSPGELKGFFSSGETGTINSNTKFGIFGIFTKPNINTNINVPIKIASKKETVSGKAKIYCTLSENCIKEYEIEIICDSTDKSATNFAVLVTDPQLINETGGIVQGMSGSPIIQDGKLVGAVTHVLVNDPTRGYGVYIENMLEVANKNS